MSTLIQLSGPPGSGKTTSVEKLNPAETFFIDADRKGLAWAGWKKQYNKEAKNYMASSDLDMIKKVLVKISSDQPQIKTVIIDTISTIANDIQMLDMKKASHDAWKDFAVDIYELYSMASELRDDLIIVFCAHTMVDPDSAKVGITKQITKMPGKMLTKVNLNGKLSYNLYTEVDSSLGTPEYNFVTQTDGTNEARSLKGVLPLRMPNDLSEVIRLIRENE